MDISIELLVLKPATSAILNITIKVLFALEDIILGLRTD